MDANALFKLTHGMYIVGAKNEDRFAGCVVDGIMQVASKPLILALSGQNTSFTKECIEKNREFSISVLGKNVNPFVVANFGFQSSRNVDKWAKVGYHVTDGLPYLDDCLAVIRCKVLDSVLFESNTLFTAEVIDCNNRNEGEPLTYSDYRTSFKNEVLKFLPEILKNKEK